MNWLDQHLIPEWRKLYKLLSVRQLEQQQVSLGNFDKNIAVGPLHIAFPKPTDDKDADLMGELDRVPSRKRRGK